MHNIDTNKDVFRFYLYSFFTSTTQKALLEEELSDKFVFQMGQH